MNSIFTRRAALPSIFFAAGFAIALLLTAILVPQQSNAQVSCAVDEALLTRLYDAIFHRPLDADAQGFVGHDVNFILNQLTSADEHAMYTGLFTAVKALEEAERKSGDLFSQEVSPHHNLIDSALSTVRAWARTLPEQTAANIVVGPDRARSAIQTAYDRMNPTAQQSARFGLFQSQSLLGEPGTISLPVVPQPSGGGGGGGY